MLNIANKLFFNGQLHKLFYNVISMHRFEKGWSTSPPGGYQVDDLPPVRGSIFHNLFIRFGFPELDRVVAGHRFEFRIFSLGKNYENGKFPCK